VIFTDRFLDLKELTDLLGISDVACTPYRGQQKRVSGVLTCSLAGGCAVASTPYRYAVDVLADGAGLLSEFGDSQGLAESIAVIQAADVLRVRVGGWRNAYPYGSRSEPLGAFGEGLRHVRSWYTPTNWVP
jgi:hypothetical protein